VRAYKFLGAGRLGVFSGFTWPEGEWVESDAPPAACHSGIHACRPEHLAYWIMDELWEIDLDGDVDETPLKVVARRGRLVARVAAWDDSARSDFMEEGVRRTSRYAALELREVGLNAEAALLEQAASVAELGALAEAVGDAAAAAGKADAADLAGYVADAVEYVSQGDLVGPAFIAAHAADVHAPVGVDDPFAAERASQGLWLAQRLGLTPGA
jgi:hypothetical protein